METFWKNLGSVSEIQFLLNFDNVFLRISSQFWRNLAGIEENFKQKNVGRNFAENLGNIS